jgi:hypothetical protein
LLKLLKANSGANYNSLNFEYQDRQFRNSVIDENLIPEYIEHMIPDSTEHLDPEHKLQNFKTKW